MPFCFNEMHTDVTVFGKDHWFNDINGGTVQIEPERNKEICPDPSEKLKKYVRIMDPLIVSDRYESKASLISDPKSGQ